MTSSRNSRFIMAACLMLMSVLLVGCQDTIPKSDLVENASQSTGGSTGGEIPKTITRPTGAVRFKPGYCICKDSVAVSPGTGCASFCNGKNTQTIETLFASFTVTEDISLNPSLKNVNGWCNTPIEDDDTDANPKCNMIARDEFGNEVILPEVSQSTDSNSLKVALNNSIQKDVPYVITLVEQSSGAKSDSVQISIPSVNLPIGDLGPIAISPISQYTCVIRQPSTITNPNGSTSVVYNSAFRLHYYYLPKFAPDPIPTNSALICHNWLERGMIDNPLYPRLELIPGVFNLWDSSDARFIDSNKDGNLDVNEVIAQKARNFGGTNISNNTQFFAKFPIMTSTQSSQNAGNTMAAAQSMGYYMSPFIDSTTKRSFCLNSSHYDSFNPLYQALRDVVGVDMEGIYVGVKAAQTVLDPNQNYAQSPADFLLIRETDLKAVWFYMNNDVPTVPTEAMVKNVAVYFYYPINKDAPYIRSSTQQLYQVKGASELNNSTISSNDNTTTGGIPTSLEPHDRKIGCIPKF